MVAACGKLGAGWKPICDDLSACGSDPRSVYLGHYGQLTNTNTRRNTLYTPCGFSSIQVSTRILGGRTAPFAPFLIPYRVPHGFTPRS